MAGIPEAPSLLPTVRIHRPRQHQDISSVKMHPVHYESTQTEDMEWTTQTHEDEQNHHLPTGGKAKSHHHRTHAVVRCRRLHICRQRPRTRPQSNATTYYRARSSCCIAAGMARPVGILDPGTTIRRYAHSTSSIPFGGVTARTDDRRRNAVTAPYRTSPVTPEECCRRLHAARPQTFSPGDAARGQATQLLCRARPTRTKGLPGIWPFGG